MRLLLIFSFIFLFSNAGYSQTAPLRSEFQSWNEVQLILPLVRAKDAQGKSFDKIVANFTGTLRIGRKNLDFLDNRIGATVDFRVNKFVTLLTGVLYRKDEIVKDRRRFETRFDIGATFSKGWRGFTFRDRNMFEHRFRNSRSDINLYRQRIQISHPIKVKNREIFSPFISEEGYLDLQLKKWTQNEFFAGITRKINRKLSVDLAYIRNDSQPVNVNGFSFGLKIKLK